MPAAETSPRILVVGCGAIGGIVAAHLLATEQAVTVLSSNSAIGRALATRGFRVSSDALAEPVPAGNVVQNASELTTSFDYILLAVQPPQVEQAAQTVCSKLEPHGRLVCFQNGLCEEIARGERRASLEALTALYDSTR